MESKSAVFKTKTGYNLEYSVVGQGEPVLIMHGGHSNCYEQFGMAEFIERGFSVITPSRPGYGRTSKELGISMETACDAYLELLEELHLPEVHVVAISAGGPSGIQFAARHPERVRSLILQSAVADIFLTPGDKLYRTARTLFRPSYEKYLWALMRFMNNLFPNLLFKSMLASFSKLPSKEVLPQISDDDRKQFMKMINLQRSGHGFYIDLEIAGQDLTSVLTDIQCPALIMHSIHDASVPMEHARHANRHIPNSRLCELESWGHLIWLGKDASDMYHKLFVFLESQLQYSSPKDERS
ncbi:alpha/beta fold hydrolase [Cohnella herbarum]|uniref:Alpha/beta hydrolase n=1 Tax=Cohnella herbarum TaxID=2728023 RepID=A0A7Z2ZLI4_9BACL|nr:alpha/beta hydrolase [Cohnella herbarum]QJD83885.1 alpha/beta hydrolase [Cohnella herbarum]